MPIVLGILVATLANHFLAGWIGAWLATLVSPDDPAVGDRGVSFVVFGLWALKPDELEEDRKLRGTGVFLTTLVAFFLVEMGDKTQLATVALAARYQSLVAVVTGTTLGMMIANVPAVWIGEALAHRVNMKWMRWVAAALFVLLGRPDARRRRRRASGSIGRRRPFGRCAEATAQSSKDCRLPRVTMCSRPRRTRSPSTITFPRRPAFSVSDPGTRSPVASACAAHAAR